VEARRDALDLRLALELADRALEQLGVEVESERGDMSVLPRAQELSRAADLEVGGREPESRSQLAELLQRAQPPPREVGCRLPAGRDEVGVRVLLAQLYQLRGRVGRSDPPG